MALKRIPIDVKQAVKNAVEYLSSLYDSNELQDLLLEEVELSDDNRYWLVTLGFTRRLKTTSPLQAFARSEPDRLYKLITVRADTGEVKSMKIRKP